MHGIFHPENPVMQFLGKLADLLIASLLWLLCSLPVITIGASTAALHYVCMQIVKNQESATISTFFRSFRENWKKATVLWLILLGALGILLFDWAILFQAPDMPAHWYAVIWGVLLLLSILWVLISIYAFGLLVYFENPLKRTLINALLLCIGHPVSSILMLVCSCLLFYLGLRFIPIILPGFPVCLNCLILHKAFSKHLPTKNSFSEY